MAASASVSAGEDGAEEVGAAGADLFTTSLPLRIPICSYSTTVAL
jgi:hypothetical protein